MKYKYFLYDYLGAAKAERNERPPSLIYCFFANSKYHPRELKFNAGQRCKAK
jgi:hypothetical protein